MDFARRKLLGILSGSWLAQACYAAVKLGVPDLLAPGPQTLDHLTAATGAHPRTLHRLLRALAAAGILQQTSGPTYALTKVGDLLRTDTDGSAAPIALMHGEEVFHAFGDIMHTVRTGEPAFSHVYGAPFYTYLDAHPEAAATFNASMGDQPAPAGFGDCDLTGVTSIVDVGGGNGALLAEILTARPDMRGTLVDRPDAVRAARDRLTAADLIDRVNLVEGDFFAPLPTGADAYVLARVLHNWNDEHALDILTCVHTAMSPGGRLYVLEEILPDDVDEAPPAAMIDLLMLVTLEGFDRTASEYRQLLDKAGFRVTAVHPGATVAAGGAIEASRGGDHG